MALQEYKGEDQTEEEAEEGVEEVEEEEISGGEGQKEEEEVQTEVEEEEVEEDEEINDNSAGTCWVTCIGATVSAVETENGMENKHSFVLSRPKHLKLGQH